MTSTAPHGIDIFDRHHTDDPYPLYRTLRETAPVCPVPGTDFFLVSTWDLVTEAASRTADFSSNLTAVMVEHPGGVPDTFDLDGDGQAIHVLATADDPTHAVHRKLVMPILGKKIRTLGPTIEAITQQLWDEELRDGRIDWASGVADRMPLALVGHLIGLPEQDTPRLLRWAYDSTEMLGGIVESGRMNQLVTSAAELAGYLHEKLAEAKSDPGTDLLGVLAQAVRDGDITDDVAVLILVQLVGAGGESTAGLIASAARILAADPELQDRLRRTPDLVEPFLDEALRLESPFRSHHRHVTTDTTLGGVELPAGSHLLLLWGSANRDPERFDNPDEVVFERPGGKSHLAFGKGAHFCVGSALARLEAKTAITTLLQRSSRFDLIDHEPPDWVPSIMVRRHRNLPLRVELATEQ